MVTTYVTGQQQRSLQVKRSEVMAYSDVPLPGKAGSQCHFVLMSALVCFGAFLNAVEFGSGTDR